MPSKENLKMLVDISSELQRALGNNKWLISGGGTNLFYEMLNSDITPPEINHLRIGGALLRGRCGTNVIEGLRQDAFVLTAEYVEIARKPSRPLGPIGTDAFGKVPHFEDRGMRYRAIAAIGKQDVIPEDLMPLTPGVTVLGASSDHLVLDIDDADPRPEMGGTLDFSFKRYGALLHAFNSDYIERVYVRDDRRA